MIDKKSPVAIPGQFRSEQCAWPDRRQFLDRVSKVAAGAALWPLSSLASIGSDSMRMVLQASFPEASGPGRFLSSLTAQLSSSGAFDASWEQIAVPDMARHVDESAGFFALSNQELFPSKAGPVAAGIFASLKPVTPLLVNSYFVVVSSKSSIESLSDLLDRARRQPGTVHYGSWKAGSLGDKYGAILAYAAKVDMKHVAYPDLSTLYKAVAEGEVDWALGTSIGPSAAAQRDGLIRYLAVADSVRDEQFNVPTIAESGGPADLYFRAWLGLFAGARTTRDVIRRVRERVVAATQNRELRALYPSMPPAFDMTAEKLSLLIKSEPGTHQYIQG